MVDPHGERTTLEDGARPSTSVASSHKSRAGNTRDKKSLGRRKGEMGDEKQRKQRLTRRLPLSHCKHRNSNSSSSSRDGALAVNLVTKFAEKAMTEPPATADPLAIVSVTTTSTRCVLRSGVITMISNAVLLKYPCRSETD